VLIDGGNVQFRAIFAYRNNPQIPATFTYCRMIIGYLKKIGIDSDTQIIVAQDYGSWRKDVDKSYKAQRQGAREEKEDKQWWLDRYEEFNDLYKKLEMSLPWQFIKIYKCESDDVASVACRIYPDKEIIHISSDKDWEQLCHFPNVKIFSPITKKYKIVKAPLKVLMDKIHGDISDNLLTVPSSEVEFERRKTIVDLISPLPNYIETPIREKLQSLLPKNLYINKIPFNTIREEIKKLYKIGE
jgi:5'-3' exonuclease